MKNIYENKNYSNSNFLNKSVRLDLNLILKLLIEHGSVWACVNDTLIVNGFKKKKIIYELYNKNLILKNSKFWESFPSLIINSNHLLFWFYKENILRFFDEEFNLEKELVFPKVIIKSYGNFLYCYQELIFYKYELNGLLIWESKISNSPPLIAFDEKVIAYYLPNSSEKLEIEDYDKVICLSQNSGEIIWKTHVENLNKNWPILLAKECLIIESDLEGIICLDVKTGTKLWNKKVIEGKKNRRYTLDYEQILHVIEVDIYLQINISDGSIIRQFDMKKEFKKLKIDLYRLANENDFGNLLGMPSFQPTVTSTHFLVSVLSMILFINKSTGLVDSIYNCTNNRSQVAELAVIADNKVVIIESVWSGAFKGNILKVFEGKS